MVNESSESPDIPVADIAAGRSSTPLPQSRVVWWGVALLAFLFAVGLTAVQYFGTGTTIQISFSHGHGLKPGDSVKHRGIDVGEVRSVELRPDTEAILVTVALHRSAVALAKEGSRFWIERPELRVGKVRGLDTLVEGRHIGVKPSSPQAAPAYAFQGEDEPPVFEDHGRGGMEILLEASQRMGLQRGSPVSYRGIEVGKIVSIGLASDGANVEARAAIQPSYRSLIRNDSKFWSSSGMTMKLGLSGLEINAESLSTIALGGVAFATPTQPGRSVATGHRFTISDKPDPRWLAWQPRITVGADALPPDSPLPMPLRIAVERPSDSLLSFRNRLVRGWILPLDDGRAIVPADLLPISTQKAIACEIAGQECTFRDDQLTRFDSYLVAELPEAVADENPGWPTAKLRVATEPEDIVVTCGSDALTIAIAATRIEATESTWIVDRRLPINDDWHGGIVVAASDGKVIGMLLTNSVPYQIATLKTEGDE